MNLHNFREHPLTDLYSPAIIQYMHPGLRQYVSGRLDIDVEEEMNKLNGAHADEDPNSQDVLVEGVDDVELDAEGIPDDDYPASVDDDTGFQDEDLGAEEGGGEGEGEGEDEDKDESPSNFHAKDYWKFTDACLEALRRSARRRSDGKEEYQANYTR